MKLECKCHGVSGSCTLRTCWLAMSDFRKTGDYLRKKYNGAIQVTMNQDGTGFTVANKNFRKPTKTDLVYFENSPDYCLMDKSAGKSVLNLFYLQSCSVQKVPLLLQCSTCKIQHGKSCIECIFFGISRRYEHIFRRLQKGSRNPVMWLGPLLF